MVKMSKMASLIVLFCQSKTQRYSAMRIENREKQGLSHKNTAFTATHSIKNDSKLLDIIFLSID